MNDAPILVAGGAGYIGSHVVRQLSEAGNRVVVMDNLASGFARALLHGEKLIQADIGDAAALSQAFSQHAFDSVLHFAASTVAPESVSKPIPYYDNNVVATLRLLEACVQHKVKHFVFSSSAAVYGEPDGGWASEDSPTNPINPYGTSKLISEWMLRDVAIAHGMRFTALRYFNVAGADPQGRIGQSTSRATHLVKTACQAALGVRDGLIVYGEDFPTPDGTGVRDYVHVEDLASAHLAALDYLRAGGVSAVLNIGYGTGNSVREVVAAVKRVTGRNFPVRSAPRRPGDPGMLVARADKVKTVIGWQPRYADLDRIVADAWRWEQRLAERQ
jgi:UDP-glucose 4-epimerase